MHEVHLEDLNHFLKCPGALEQCVKRKLKEGVAQDVEGIFLRVP